MKIISQKRALNALAPGGQYSVQPALDVALGVQDSMIIPDGFKEIVIQPQHNCYVLFHADTGETISTTNDLQLLADEKWETTIPYDMGQQAADKSVVLYVKQVGSNTPSSVRVILR